MSHNIYKTIHQNSDGSFEGETAESNVFDLDNRYIFDHFHNDFFNTTLPNATNEQKKIAWLITSAYWGDVYYNNWKNDLKLIINWIEKAGYKCAAWNYGKSPEDIEAINNCLEFCKQHKQARRKYKVLLNGQWIKRITKKRAFTTYYSNEAKIFIMTEEEITNRFAGYKQYNPEFIPQDEPPTIEPKTQPQQLSLF